MHLPSSVDKDFATWCVMDHARPALVRALHVWGMGDIATVIESAASTGALRLVAGEVSQKVRRVIVFGPLRRDLASAASTLQLAATFAGRGDAENTAAMSVGVFTNTASALSWRRPWTRLGWRKRRAEVIALAVSEQRAFRDTQ